MNQSEKSILFAQMHRKGQPLLLYNIWDAGSALAVVSTGKKTGAKALATSSWAVASRPRIWRRAANAARLYAGDNAAHCRLCHRAGNG